MRAADSVALAAVGVDFSEALLELEAALGEVTALGFVAAGAGAGVAEAWGSDALGLRLLLADLGAGAACESLTRSAEFDSSGLGRDAAAAPCGGVLAVGALEGVGRGFAAGSWDDGAPALALPAGDGAAFETLPEGEGGAGGTEPRPEVAGGAGLEGVCGNRLVAPTLLLAGRMDGADVTT